MRILVTNDDGIESEGIHVLARAVAAAGHEVVVVAPSTNWSGAGAALGDLRPDQPLSVRRVEIPGAADLEAWALDGPPALCVVAGRLGAFGAEPELVVSGINAGLNTGRAILHSGTVGAVLAGQNFGISGLAVSAETAEPWHWDTAAELAVEVLPLVIDGPARTALNLNVPALPRAGIRGVRWARIAPLGAVRARLRGSDDEQVQFSLEPTGYEPPEDTDQGACDAGYAALTTLVGIVEAWPDPVESEEFELAVADSSGVTVRLEPGAELHEVHTIPDATDHRLLRRPELGVIPD
ncbi:MAG: 5'/3'-nucleotidase SurE [Microthrixaceae bacterium]